MSEDRPGAPKVYRVGELNRRLVVAIEKWPEVWVEGEVSDVRRASAGHVYFTLADAVESAQLGCVMFATDARRSKAELRVDARVRVRGRFDFYRPRGALQLVVKVALPAGEGDRREQIERIKKRLAKDGLLAVERKRPLPRFPRTVGVVTSRRGAALHDVIRVASRRAPVRLVLSHCLVQGPDAPASIVMALKRLEALPDLDVVIVTRGGGASVDLSAFDDEAVARAIAACPVPVVSGVGHEVDASIADLVADVRAATPSNAAELVVPEREVLVETIATAERRLCRALQVRVGEERLALERLDRRLRDPRHAASGVRRQFDATRVRLERAVERAVLALRERLRAPTVRLERADPRLRLEHQRRRLEELTARMQRTLRPLVAARRAELTRAATRLEGAPAP
ncbi:MAG: exodeoxyribonuclease VII large subunit, partial [Myxococcales bacterium]|nr:exodeoxyribonuclease VII large subunit [Myxococcales bacterium]